jgi:ABC-type transport system involved in multi-copper enzyme maturation permease subunit
VKITMDLGLAVINLSGILISIFLGVTLVAKEIDNKSIYSIISKPMKRYKFVLGKFLGLSIIIFVNVFLMTLIVIVNVKLLGGSVPNVFFYATLLMFSEMMIMITVAMCFSSFTTIILASMFSIGIYVIAHSSSTFSTIIKKATGLKYGIIYLADLISPNFEVLNLKNLVTQTNPVLDGKIIVGGLFYSLMYIAFFLTITIVILSRKDFK